MLSGGIVVADPQVTVQWYLKEEQPFASATWQMMLGAASSIMALFGVGPTYHYGSVLTGSTPSTTSPTPLASGAGNG
jgi:hypothetical protein